jgi:hypothetical protein
LHQAVHQQHRRLPRLPLGPCWGIFGLNQQQPVQHKHKPVLRHREVLLDLQVATGRQLTDIFRLCPSAQVHVECSGKQRHRTAIHNVVNHHEQTGLLFESIFVERLYFLSCFEWLNSASSQLGKGKMA